jgi:hypothetical protein
MKLYSRLDSDLEHPEANRIGALFAVKVLHTVVQEHSPLNIRAA